VGEIELGVGQPRVASVLAAASCARMVLLVPAIDMCFQLTLSRPGNPDSELPWIIALRTALIARLVELIAGVSVDGQRLSR
jgi:hypothetical protein